MLVPAAVTAAPVDRLLPGGAVETPRGETDQRVQVEMVRTESGGDSSRYSAADSDTQPTLQTRHFGTTAELSCEVAEQPNALVVVNHSSEPLPAGTRIKWTLASAGQRGFFALIGPLEGGETLVADDVLDGAVERGAGCVARTI